MKKIILAMILLIPLALSTTIIPELNNNELLVKVSSAKDLYGVQFSIAYNPQVLSVQEVTKGGFFESDGIQAFFSKGNKKNGIIENIIYLRIGNVKGISGEGILTKVKFEKLSEGEVGILIKNIILINSKNEKVQASVEPLKTSQDYEMLTLGTVFLITIIGIILIFLIKKRKLRKKKNGDYDFKKNNTLQ